MWWTKFILLIVVTIGVTSLILWIDSRLKKYQKTNPGIRPTFRLIVYIILNL
jgi:hypothetical protein